MMSLSLLPLERQRTLAELLNHSLTSREELLARAISTCHALWAAAPTVEAELPPAAADSTDLVASVAHEVNRAYCAFLFDYSQLPWADASDGIKASARSGVEFHLANPDAGPDAGPEGGMDASAINEAQRLMSEYITAHGLGNRMLVVHQFTPGMIRIQLSRMPDGIEYFCLARTIHKDSGGWHAQQPVQAIGLGCQMAYAKELVYSDGLDVGNAEAYVPVGVTCRVCDRVDCDQRVLPSLKYPLEVNENVRKLSLYAPQTLRTPR